MFASAEQRVCSAGRTVVTSADEAAGPTCHQHWLHAARFHRGYRDAAARNMGGWQVRSAATKCRNILRGCHHHNLLLGPSKSFPAMALMPWCGGASPCIDQRRAVHNRRALDVHSRRHRAVPLAPQQEGKEQERAERQEGASAGGKGAPARVGKTSTNLGLGSSSKPGASSSCDNSRSEAAQGPAPHPPAEAVHRAAVVVAAGQEGALGGGEGERGHGGLHGGGAHIQRAGLPFPGCVTVAEWACSSQVALVGSAQVGLRHPPRGC
jgi:hypothetical protein